MEERNLPQNLTENFYSLSAEIANFQVVDSITYNRAGQIVVALKDLKKKIQDYFKPMKDKAYKAWKEICDTERAELSKIEPYEKKLSGLMISWQVEQERKRAEEQRKVEEELRKREEELRLRVAEELEKQGKKEEAEKLLEEPIDIPTIKVDSEVPKVDGMTTREEWLFEIVDESQIPREFLMPDEKKIRAYVRAMKDKARIPGVKIYKSAIIVRRS